MWCVEVRETLKPGTAEASGRFRLTASSDEGGGGPWGDLSHDHATREEAKTCERCDEYVAKVTGFPSRKQHAADVERHERAELARLKAKYEGPR